MEEIARQRDLPAMPLLKDVIVCVAGAVASPPARAATVERFWRAYLAAAGATIEEGAFARTLTSCKH